MAQHKASRVVCLPFVWGGGALKIPEMSKNKPKKFWGPKVLALCFQTAFSRTNLQYKSKLQSASNDFKFSVHQAHKIIRPLVKKLAQLDIWYTFLKSYGADAP